MWHQLLGNRFFVTFAVLGAIIVTWNVVVASSNDGYLRGRVVTQDGAAAADAQVVISELSLISRNIIDTAVTDEDGWFEFEKHDHHAMVLQAEKDGAGQSRRHNIRLYFRNQNKSLEEPIVLDSSIVGGPKISKQSGAN